MPESKLTADSLVLSDPTHARGIVHAAVSHASPDDESALGRLFFLFALDDAAPQLENMFAKLQTAITDIYYRNREGTDELNFEKAVQEGNQVLRLYINERNRSLLEKFHAVIGVINGTTLYLTTTGTIHLFLARGPRIIDIVERQAVERANPVRVFSHLIAGELRLGDRVLACTTSILDYVSIEKLRQIINGTPTANARFSLETLLKESLPSHTFGAIIMGMNGTVAHVPVAQSTPNWTPPSPAPVMAQSSMADLQARSQATTELLTPSLWRKTKAVTHDLLNGLSAFTRTRILRRRPRRTIERPTDVITYRPSAATTPTSSKVLGRVRRAGITVVGAARATGIAITDMVRRRRSVSESIRQLPSRTNENINRTVYSYRRLSTGQKRLLMSAGILLLIFAGSIVWRGVGQEATITEQEKADLTTAIEQKIFQAASALTYGDDTGAIAILNEASGLLEQYPSRSKADKDQRAAWQSRIDSEREKTKHITRLDTVPVFASLANIDSTPPIHELVRLGTTVYTATAAKLIIIDGDGTVTSVDLPAHEGTPQQIAAIGQNIIMILTDTGQMIEYTTTTQSFRTVAVPFVNEDRTIADMVTYETRVYFLDTKNNQIFRHTRASTAYSGGQTWIDDGTSVTDTAGIAVDGALYTLGQNGTLLKLVQGTRAGDFTVSPIEPALAQASSIWTDTAATLLYVLDPSERRLATFTKTGALKGQYMSEQIGSVTALAVNQAETTAYLLTDAAILSIPLE